MAWSATDKQSFADGDVLKAKTVPVKRDGGPQVDEWDDGHDWGVWADEWLDADAGLCDLADPETCEACD